MVLKNGVVFKGEEFVECPVAVKDGVIVAVGYIKPQLGWDV